MNFTDLLGSAAAVTATIAMAPQVMKVYKTKNTGGLSLGSFTLLTSALFLWFIYGLLIGAYPIIISNLLGFTLNMYIVIMKIKHG